MSSRVKKKEWYKSFAPSSPVLLDLVPVSVSERPTFLPVRTHCSLPGFPSLPPRSLKGVTKMSQVALPGYFTTFFLNGKTFIARWSVGRRESEKMGLARRDAVQAASSCC